MTTTRAIAFVCLGNICRSPTAQGVLSTLVAEQHRSQEFTIGSYGLGPWHVGRPPDERAQASALHNGIDLSSQRAEQITDIKMLDWDVLVAMDRSILGALEDMAPRAAQDKLDLFGFWLPKSHPMYGKDVPDPYGRTDQFDSVFAMIRSGCENYLATS